MDAAERRHETAVFFITLGVAITPVLWWMLLFSADGWIRVHYDVTDISLGSHMGTDATLFAYDLVLCIAFLLPAFVLSAWHALRHRYLGTLTLSLGLLWLVNTIAFYAGGRDCTPIQQRDPGAWWFVFAGLTGGILACVACGIAVGRRVDKGFGKSLAVAASLTATIALIDFVQWSNCAGPSTQVARDLSVFVAPLMTLFAFPIVWIGTLIGRATRAVPPTS
jgi:hypothetical protein